MCCHNVVTECCLFHRLTCDTRLPAWNSLVRTSVMFQTSGSPSLSAPTARGTCWWRHLRYVTTCQCFLSTDPALSLPSFLCSLPTSPSLTPSTFPAFPFLVHPLIPSLLQGFNILELHISHLKALKSLDSCPTVQLPTDLGSLCSLERLLLPHSRLSANIA